MDEIRNITHCGHCNRSAIDCSCNAYQRQWHAKAAAERRVNLDAQKNQKSEPQRKLDMIKTIRSLHEENIMSLMRLRTRDTIQEAEKMLHASFYDVLDHLESQLKAEMAE
ncbi:MAG: hypothetical protein LPK02_07025 [Rhodobacterales bacterium]|nr:hypothetical protein [Rhodobacterales bacterium]